ncbi:MAG: FecCD family ABC transporter permease [Propionibacteriaceae bacterium]
MSRAHQCRQRRLPAWLLAIILILNIAITLIYSLTFGAELLPFEHVWSAFNGAIHNKPGISETADVIVRELRLPRAVLAVLVGAGLSLAGAGMQTLVRNPLADPYILGVSSGASVGATAVITMGLFTSLGLWALSSGALVGALLASLLVYGVAIAQGGLIPLRLVLSGVVLSSAFSALASFLVFRAADPRAAQSVLFWLLGSLSGAQWNRVPIALGCVIICGTIMWAGSGWLDALASGEELAASLGIQVGLLRTMLFVLLSVLVGVMVSLAGGIGFVGLVIPHLTRRLAGARHRVLLPICALLGGLFLLWVDIVSRVIARPMEVPLGVVTGVIGAPLFILLMGRRTYQFGENS